MIDRGSGQLISAVSSMLATYWHDPSPQGSDLSLDREMALLCKYFNSGLFTGMTVPHVTGNFRRVKKHGPYVKYLPVAQLGLKGTDKDGK